MLAAARVALQGNMYDLLTIHRHFLSQNCAPAGDDGGVARCAGLLSLLPRHCQAELDLAAAQTLCDMAILADCRSESPSADVWV